MTQFESPGNRVHARGEVQGQVLIGFSGNQLGGVIRQHPHRPLNRSCIVASTCPPQHSNSKSLSHFVLTNDFDRIRISFKFKTRTFDGVETVPMSTHVLHVEPI